MPEPQLLDTYLKQLRLPTLLHNYRKLAEDALVIHRISRRDVWRGFHFTGVRMRPIASPQNAMRIRGDQRACEGCNV